MVDIDPTEQIANDASSLTTSTAVETNPDASDADDGALDAASAPNTGAELSYALKWDDSDNPSYDSFGDDCTNYVSQILHAGGMPFVIRGSVPIGIGADDEWYNIGPNMPHGGWSWTRSWSVADDFIHYFLNDGHATRVPVGSWKAGEFVGWVWNDEPGQIDHVSYIASVKGVTPYFLQHTPNYTTEEPLSYVQAQAKAKDGGIKETWVIEFHST